jgi:hypothetical protein
VARCRSRDGVCVQDCYTIIAVMIPLQYLYTRAANGQEPPVEVTIKFEYHGSRPSSSNGRFSTINSKRRLALRFCKVSRPYFHDFRNRDCFLPHQAIDRWASRQYWLCAISLSSHDLPASWEGPQQYECSSYIFKTQRNH